MRETSRADLVVWLAICVTTVLVIGRLRPHRISLHDLGITDAPTGPVWLLAFAGAVAAGVIWMLPRLASLSWAALQGLTLIVGAAWTASLVGYRDPSYGGAEVGTYLGNALSPVLNRMAHGASWAPAIVVATAAGIAIVLLNAAMQSLAGQVQAQRLAPVLMLSPAVAVLADGLDVLALLAVSGVIALSAMASERGRGLLWSSGLALLSEVLLFAGALAGFASTAAGIGMLCIYFLRRRSLMIVVAAIGVLISLISADAIGWSWPDRFGEASALKLANPAVLATSTVIGSLAVIAFGGPVLREAWRKVRATAAWPLMLTGLVAAFISVLTRPSTLGVIPASAMWLPLLAVAASAPPVAAGTPEGPSRTNLAITSLVGIAGTAAMSLYG